MADEPQVPKDEWLSPTPAGNTGAPRDEWLSPNPTVAEQAVGAGKGLVSGLSGALVSAVTAPYRAVDWVGEKITGGDFLPNAEDMPMYRPYLRHAEPTNAGERYGRGVGEAVGMTLPMTGGALAAAPKLAAMAPTSTIRGIGQQIGAMFSRSPTAAVAADVVAATGAGLSQQAAQEAGFSPPVQATAGMVGGMLPFAPAAVYSGTRRAISSARANSDPHARVAASLGDQPIDDLSSAIATGHTGIDEPIARRVLDTLGEEMVRANGNRGRAVTETLHRLEVEGGVTPATAREQLRRVTASQADSELLFGEYPTVTQSNLDTRGLQHSPEAMETLQLLGVDAIQNTGRRSNVANANRLMAELGISRPMARQRLTAARGVLEDERAAGNIQDSGAQWLTDYLANSGAGASSQLVRNTIHERTPAMLAQARNTLRGMSPNRQTIEDAEELVTAMTRQAGQEYNAVHNTPGAVNYGLLHGPTGQNGMVQRTLERHLQRAAGRNDDQADALREAIDRFYVTQPRAETVNTPYGPMSRNEMPTLQDDLAATRMHIREARRQGVDKDTIDDMSRMADALAEVQRRARRDINPSASTQQTISPTLRHLQDARSGVRGQMEAARRAGRDDIVAVLQPLYRDMTRVMERSSPQWRIANRRWADMNIAERAQELGDGFALQANPRYREQLTEFRAMAPEAQDLVRVHFVQKLLDRITNPGETHDLAKLFSTPHIRNAVRTILGDDAAMALSRFIRDQRVATKSKGMLSGSQTHARGQRQNEQDADLGILASVENASTSGFRKWLMDKTVNILRERRNKPLANIVTTPIRDTAGVAEHLERMRGARELAARYANPGIRQTGIVGRYGSIPAPFGEDQ